MSGEETPEHEDGWDNEDVREWLRRQLDGLERVPEIALSPEEWEARTYEILREFLPVIRTVKIAREHFSYGLVLLLDRIVGLPR